jgi:hypothetical protein
MRMTDSSSNGVAILAVAVQTADHCAGARPRGIAAAGRAGVVPASSAGFTGSTPRLCATSERVGLRQPHRGVVGTIPYGPRSGVALSGTRVCARPVGNARRIAGPTRAKRVHFGRPQHHIPHLFLRLTYVAVVIWTTEVIADQTYTGMAYTPGTARCAKPTHRISWCTVTARV